MATPKWPYTEVVAGVVVDYDAAAQQLVERMADRKSATEMLIEEDRKKTRQRLYRKSEMDVLKDRIQELEGEVVMLRDLNSVTEQLLVDAETRLRDREPPF